MFPFIIAILWTLSLKILLYYKVGVFMYYLKTSVLSCWSSVIHQFSGFIIVTQKFQLTIPLIHSSQKTFFQLSNYYLS